MENTRSTRDLKKLSVNFDRHATTKKETGDPSSPETFRMERRLSRVICNFACAAAVGESDKDDDRESYIDK